MNISPKAAKLPHRVRLSETLNSCCMTTHTAELEGHFHRPVLQAQRFSSAQGCHTALCLAQQTTVWLILPLLNYGEAIQTLLVF
jgi:hypothetical protein